MAHMKGMRMVIYNMLGGLSNIIIKPTQEAATQPS